MNCKGDETWFLKSLLNFSSASHLLILTFSTGGCWWWGGGTVEDRLFLSICNRIQALSPPFLLCLRSTCLIIFDLGNGTSSMHFPLFIILFICELHFWIQVLISHVLVAFPRWFMLTIFSLSISLSANGSVYVHRYLSTLRVYMLPVG
jgi:hypothetical protein